MLDPFSLTGKCLLCTYDCFYSTRSCGQKQNEYDETGTSMF